MKTVKSLPILFDLSILHIHLIYTLYLSGSLLKHRISTRQRGRVKIYDCLVNTANPASSDLRILTASSRSIIVSGPDDSASTIKRRETVYKTEDHQPLLQFLQYLNRKPVARLVYVQLGVWDVVVRKSPQRWLPALPSKDDLKEYASNASIVWRFIKEIHTLAPRQFWIHAINGLWLSFEVVLSAYTSDRIYNAVINHLYDPNADVRRICYAVASQAGLIVARIVIEKLVKRDEEILRDRITYHFLTKSISASLHYEKDFPDPQISSRTPFYSRSYFNSKALAAFDGLSLMITSVIKMASQLLFTYNVVRQHPLDPAFIFINVIQPFFSFASRDYLWTKEYFSYCSNKPFKRMMALYRLASMEQYSTDIKSDGVGDYITKEFEHSRSEVGDTCTEELGEQWLTSNPLPSLIFNDFVQLSPMLYFAVRLIFYPKSLTPSSYAQLQHAASAIHSSVYTVSIERRSSAQNFLEIRDIYQEEDDTLKYCARENQLIPYPRNEEKSLHSGMEVEFRDVSFCYPGSSKNALNNVSFAIKPGQLVAIVGVNGSGKSSITNLFNRLYDPSEGEILVDGLPLRSYRRADVRRSMAILRQSHILYPLSLRENISLGLPDRPSNDLDLDIAVKCGGASNFIDKLPENFDTGLCPIRTVSSTIDLSEDDPLLAPLKAIQDTELHKDVSGGEGQRLAASRAFLRLRGGGIRFLAADEPTSALDPEGEFELFTRLKQQRGDMTVVFVTHRFGHITKHADLILCMKDGYLVEQGTHDELIAKGEEYYKLHSVQAQAFSMESGHKDAQIRDLEEGEENGVVVEV